MIDLQGFFQDLQQGKWDTDPSKNPPVNEADLVRYVEQTLSSEESLKISRLIVTSLDWRERYFNLVLGKIPKPPL